MGKKVIIVKDPKRVFRTLEEASRELGMHPSTLSRAISDGANWVRYGDRVFAVLPKGGGDWMVVTENSRGSGYLCWGNPTRKVSKRDVVEVRELTLAWYL